MAVLVYQVHAKTSEGVETVIGEYYSQKVDEVIRKGQETNRLYYLRGGRGHRMTWNLVFDEPVYYRISERDIDLVETVRVQMFQNEREADLAFDRIYSCAKGPVKLQKITKDEYDSFVPVVPVSRWG